MPKTVPTQPYLLLSLALFLLDKRVNSSPIIGVNKRLKIKAHVKPMLRLLPTNPTKTEKKHPEIKPKIIIDAVI